MSINITMTDGPLEPATPWACDGAGAVIVFDGIVRPSEGDEPIEALDYEQYRPMTMRQLQRLAERIVDEFGLLAIDVEHSIGRVAVGEASFRLRIASRHRGEGLAAMGAFIDRMKRDVPLWKTPVYAEAAAPGAGRRA